ncbi:MAG: uracil phosphoribosyltransferase [Thermaerobacter sp.]|nr:MAG: uracil phosphoribosyltransferase [Bacillota bacterium]
MSEVLVLDHPLIQHKLALLRDKRTGPKDFRELLDELSMLMAYEVTRHLPTEEVEVETPVGVARCRVVTGLHLALIPILRAGLGMVNGILRLVPTAKVGHIGLYRDHDTLQPVAYYCKLPPDLAQREVIVLDPMLATGGSAAEAVHLIRRQGARNIRLMCLVAAPEGIEVFHRAHPDVPIYTAAVDQCLNEKGYIVPGLGDAGDRLFGTR